MAKVNIVIAGNYEGKEIQKVGNVISIKMGGFLSNINDISLNKNTVQSYGIVNEDYRKSATSAVGRGIIGGVLLGPVGWLAGLSAKNKGVHTWQINFFDGKKSLIAVDDKINSALIKNLF